MANLPSYAGQAFNDEQEQQEHEKTTHTQQPSNTTDTDPQPDVSNIVQTIVEDTHRDQQPMQPISNGTSSSLLFASLSAVQRRQSSMTTSFAERQCKHDNGARITGNTNHVYNSTINPNRPSKLPASGEMLKRQLERQVVVPTDNDAVPTALRVGCHSVSQTHQVTHIAAASAGYRNRNGNSVNNISSNNNNNNYHKNNAGVSGVGKPFRIQQGSHGNAHNAGQQGWQKSIADLKCRRFSKPINPIYRKCHALKLLGI
jgi:hypothetical protein